MFLIFDTETTGLPQFNVPFDHPAQARIVQLGCILLDSEFEEVASYSSLIYPKDWTIQPDAQAKHNISIEQCKQYGLPIEAALDVFDAFCERSDKIVAFGLKFDAHLMDVEQTLRKGFTNRYEWTKDGICVMLESTNVCKLPHATNKYRGYKWPKLQEAYEFMFHETFEDAHDALADCRATARVFKWLVEHNIVNAKREVLVA